MVTQWPEPIVSVQALSQTGLTTVPNRYIKPAHQRPVINNSNQTDARDMEIPVVDMSDYDNEEEKLKRVSSACKEWGFFQVVNHGVSHELMERVRGAWREFFELPLEEKRKYANTPDTYEGYGSRLGVVKDAKLDWSDYFYLNYLPCSIRDSSKWPSQPPKIRKLIEEYGEEVTKLCERLVETISKSLGLELNNLMKAFGGKDKVGASMRANFYPKCPQPELTLGLSSHSDPGGITIVLPDEKVSGLQVRRGDSWVTVKSIPNALIVNIGDQIKILSNGIYKSVEHQVIVNSGMARVSLALFYNPRGDIPIEPIKELLAKNRPALYKPIRFDEYRLLIRQKGACGKNQVDSILANK